MNYTLHQLKIFLYVVEYESVTKASEALFLTQPAVSIQLKNLQNQFDVPLTEVIGRKLYVTDFGRKLADYASEMLRITEEIEAATSQYKGVLSGEIKLSVVSTGKYVMPYFLKGFTKQYPNVRINMNVTNKNTVVEALLNNETDFALVSVINENLNVNHLELMENELYLVGSTDAVKELNKKNLKAKDLEELTLVFREKGSATRDAMVNYLESHELNIRSRLSLVSNEAVKQAVNAGLGFSIMPKIGLKHALLSGEMSLVPVKDLPIRTTWNLVYNKGKNLSPASEAYLDFIRENKDAIIEQYFSWVR